MLVSLHREYRELVWERFAEPFRTTARCAGLGDIRMPLVQQLQLELSREAEEVKASRTKL